jgi:uncharacterized protein (DUF1501 family)
MNDRLDQLISRRSFLRRGACASLGMGGLASQLFTARMVHAALADGSFNDYRALVCVFLFGGNDNGNTIIPYDGGSQNYSFYQGARGNLAIPQADLANTIIAPGNTGGRRFAFHPAMTDMKALFDQGNLAVLSNVGTLVEPTTKTAYQNDAVRVPRQLFAHNWQQEQWQFSTADAIEKFGWGGRVADALQAAGVNASAPVSMVISIAGANVFLTGRNVTPYAVSPWGARTLTTWGLGNGSEQAITKQAFADLLALQNNPAYAGQHAMQKAYADITQRAVTNSEIVDALLDKPSGVQTPIPENNWLASQLHMVARLIEYAQSDLLHNRQIFFVAIGGFDNHDGLVGNGTDPGPHDTRLAEVNGGLKFFWDALGDLGMRDQVTTFTASDFGRTYVSNGNGSDHGWGSDQFVLGGAQVNGGQLYGTYPNLTVDGPEDTGSGRYIPTTSVDAYSFEMARWMGVPVSEMPTVLPNLTRFLDPTDAATHLGILS